jgi:hypothetical protein
MPKSPYADSIHSRELVRSDDGFPVKLYNFKSALDSDAWPDIDSIKESLLKILKWSIHYKISKSPSRYAIGLSWGYFERIPVRAFDVCSYKFSKSWNEDNPDVDMQVFKNGYESMWTNKKICETGTIILGEEAKLRRKTGSLEEFLNKWPFLGDLGPIIEDVQDERR